MKISASIYSDKKRSLKETILDLKAHQVDLLHVDCNDDISVFEDIEKIREWCDLPIDLHIITETPEKFYSLLKKHPVEYVTFQQEQLPKDFLLPSDLPGKKGLAIITPTPIEVFDRYNGFDFILFMATTPGQSGGVFTAENFKKIRLFKKKYPLVKVHVDGGVNGEVSFILRNMGVRASVSGSFLFKAASVGQALMDLTKREITSQFQVKDFMHDREECPIISLDELNLKNVLSAIENGALGFVMVEENDQFAGIISNADVRRGLLNCYPELNDVDVKKWVNRNPLVLKDSDTVNSMLLLVKEQAFSPMYLPVVNENGNSAGVVTFLNLIKGEV